MAVAPSALADALRDRYLIERELGRGGMATVYLARDLKHDRPVALKVLHSELAATLGPERFHREIRLTARLQHPHILAVHDSGEAAGRLWYTMPYVEGESLRQRLIREKQLPLDDALQIARNVLAALSYAHSCGVVHRDIKPENILLERGEAVVADFGIAHAVSTAGSERLTETGLSLGTPAYMSPEQAVADRAVDGRSDIYSLGCVLYEMLAGEPPYTGPTAQAIMARRLTEPVRSLRTVRETVPDQLERAVVRALARVPADRFPTAAEFAQALQTGQATDSSLAMTATAGARHTARPKVPLLALVLGLLVIATMGILLWRRGPHPRAGVTAAAATPSGASSVPRSAQAPVAAAVSVAVLPFVNLSPNRENEYFSDGMTEELITALGRVEGLRVAARASSFAFKGKPLDLGEISRKLKVGAVLDGSVRRAGTRLRVTAELVQASDGTRLWAESYDRELRDVFAVQDDLARAIVGALRGRLELPTREGGGLVKTPTRNLAAHDLYLQGRYVWNERTHLSLLRAASYFARAAARDSTYAEAYAGLADTYVLLPFFGLTPPRDAFPKAKRMAERAVALDSSLAEAHTSLGEVRMLDDFDWRGAEAEFQRAIALNPNYATAHQWYAEYLRASGRLADGLAEMERARELDPLSRIIAGELGYYLALSGRYDEALRLLRATLELDPTFARAYVHLCNVYLVKQMPREATAACERAVALSGRTQVVWRLAYAYAASGDRPKAMAILHELEARSRREYVQPSAIAVARLAVGDTSGAFAWLDSAYVARDPALTLSSTDDPVWSSLRADARFVRLRRRMGLSP